jgi:hypothetical protein
MRLMGGECRRSIRGLVAAAVIAVTAPCATAAQAPDLYALVRRQPMIFFLAKGAPNARGVGCSEWIAAEGMIDLDASQRLRDFLGTLSRRDMPIFFNSAGGDVRQSLLLGGILRERRMTAGVGRTLPEGCRNTGSTDDACRRLMQSKKEHKARLVTAATSCVSGCAYALLGGAVRQVAPDAQLGVHSVRPSARAAAERPPINVDDAHRLLRLYAIEMGVDPGLIDVAAKVSADRVRYVSRDELARFGIETRGFYETRWLLSKDAAQRPFVVKSVTQAEGADKTDFRTSQVRVVCEIGSRIPFLWRRDVLPKEMGVASVVRVVADGRELALTRKVTVEAIEVWYEPTDLEFFRVASAAANFVITEVFTPADNAPGWSREIKFSTVGLSKELEELRKDCAQLKVSDPKPPESKPPESKPADGAGRSGRR